MLEIKDCIIYLDGKVNKEFDNVQYCYLVKIKCFIFDDLVYELGISKEDMMMYYMDVFVYNMFLMEKVKVGLLVCKDIVVSIENILVDDVGGLYLLNMYKNWIMDNYGFVWIFKKGEMVKFMIENFFVYECFIYVYEGNELVVKDGKIYINGKEIDEYIFKMDYYWMMGDNCYNLVDFCFWGFVFEDYVVGKFIFIWLLLDNDCGWLDGKICWN